MNVQQRKELLVRLGNYMTGNEEQWQAAKERAYAENRWFIPEFIDLSVRNIALNYLQPEQLERLIGRYRVPFENLSPKKIGIVMAGNIPLVGFHDLICVLISGNLAIIKLSSKDEVLTTHLFEKMKEWDPAAGACIQTSHMIPNCDAYIATGSNNAARYFEYYFQKYPSIIRSNRTSVAMLTGNETGEELEKLADDVYQYFGLGCRNVTKLFVPKNYDFLPLLEAFKKYDRLADHNKYKNNYDYNLAILIMNNRYFMTNGSILLVEDPSPFSRIGQVHYEYYSDQEALSNRLQADPNIQCLVGGNGIGFGRAQMPEICDYADGRDTMDFLMRLSN
jgi:hypothetical protein